MSFPPVSSSVFNDIIARDVQRPIEVSQLTPVQSGVAGVVVGHEASSKYEGLDTKRYSKVLQPFIDYEKGAKFGENSRYFTVTQLTKDNIKKGSLSRAIEGLRGIWRQELEYVIRKRDKGEKEQLEKKIKTIVDSQVKAFQRGKTIEECQREIAGICDSFVISNRTKRMMQTRLARRAKREKERSEGVIDRLRSSALLIIQLARKTGRSIQEIDSKAIEVEKANRAAAFQAELLAELDRETRARPKERVQKRKKKKKKASVKRSAPTPQPSQVTPLPVLSIEEERERTKVKMLLDLHSSRGIPTKMHIHASRWEGADPDIVRTFEDQPGPGKTPYSSMNDMQCLTEIACHQLRGVLHFFKEPFQSRYTYPYTYVNPKTKTAQKGFGLYAEMVRGESVQSGVITVGMTKKRVVYHLHFKALSEKVESGADLIEALEVPSSGRSAEVKWEGGPRYRFDSEGEGVIKMDAPGGAFFRIYPVD